MSNRTATVWKMHRNMSYMYVVDEIENLNNKFFLPNVYDQLK